MANLGLLAGLVTGAYQALQNKLEAAKPTGGGAQAPAPTQISGGAAAYQPAARAQTAPQSAAAATEYYDPTGQKREGWIINGQTYQDQAGKNAVGLGSLVQTGGGWFQKTANGGVKVDTPTGVSYTDADGSRAYGYLVNGQTFRDPLGRNPIAVGSIVKTGGGNFLKTENGGIPATDWDALRLQTAAQERKMNAAADAAYQAGKLRYEQQRPGINSQYDTSARQLYANYMQEKQAMPEQMARMGLAGQGVSETTAARMSTAYMGNLSQSEIARRQALAEIDNKIAALFADTETQKAQNAAAVQGNVANAYQNYWQQEQAQKNTDRQFAMSQQQFDYEKQQNAYAQALSKAEMLAQYGDFSGYEALGIDTAKMKAAWAQAQAAPISGSGSSRRSSGSSSKSSGSGGTSKSGNSKMGYSQIAQEIIKANSPVKTFEELSANQSISSSDYEKLKMLAEEQTDKNFEQEMKDIKARRTTYDQIKAETGFMAEQMIDEYGYERYRKLLKAAFEATGRR